MKIRLALLLAALVLPSATGCQRSYFPGGESRSPDGKLTATFYGFAGGGAGGWATQHVTVRPSYEEFVVGENVIVRMAGTSFVCLEWHDPNYLKVWASGFAENLSDLASLSNPRVKFEGRFENAAALEAGCKGDFLRLRAAPET